MKRQLIIMTLLFGLLFGACNNPSSDKTSDDKEKELLKKELELTKKELELKEKESLHGTFQQSEGATQTDIHDDPVKVVEEIFNAAKSGDYSKLSGLCDPEGKNDGDTKTICNTSTLSTNAQEEFKNYFSKGKVVSNAEITGDVAKVKIKFGHNGDKDEEFELVKRNNKWFISSI